MTSRELRALLRAKYPEAEYAMLSEVRNGAGFDANRSTDAIIVGLWPSRGLYIEGVEIKVSRSDWKREKQRPDKGEESAAYCDFYWVLSPAGVVPVEEIPPAWGLMEAEDRKITVTKKPEKLSPKPLDRSFVAAMLKRAQATGLSEKERAEIKKAAQETSTRAAQRDTEHLEREMQRTVDRIQRFEEASGVRLDDYREPRIGEAVRMVLAGQHLTAKRTIESAIAHFDRAAEELRKITLTTTPEAPDE
jgi:hypothetical protein